MTIPIIASVIRALWRVGEILHQRGQQVKLLKNLDRNSGRFWDVANAIEPVEMILGFTGIGLMQRGVILSNWPDLPCLTLGMIIRGTAIGILSRTSIEPSLRSMKLITMSATFGIELPSPQLVSLTPSAYGRIN